MLASLTSDFFTSDHDLAKGNKMWTCVTETPLFSWYEEFFRCLGSEFGELVKVSP